VVDVVEEGVEEGVAEVVIHREVCHLLEVEIPETLEDIMEITEATKVSNLTLYLKSLCSFLILFLLH
jgi:hypothetical protein